jgi:cell wall-associated NlpC family hydrolase
MWGASILVLGALVALVVVPTGLADPSSLASKQAQVDRVLSQIQGLDSSLSRAIEAYNAANNRLAQIRGDLQVNTRRLAVARVNLRVSQKTLSDRLVAIYTSGSNDDSTLSVLLGASSFSDLLSRIDTVDRVSEQDSRIERQVSTFKREVVRRQARLRNARAEQQQIVAQRAAHKVAISQQLTERRQLVSSIRSEIVRIKAEEARRQAELERQARVRAAAAAAAPVFTAPIGPTSSTSSSSSSSTAASGAPTTISQPAAPLPAGHGSVVGVAMRYLGVPYRWGGASPSGFDCSGLVMYAYAQVGVSLPHSSYAQYGMGTAVPRNALQPGDLVFFDGLGHVGLYIGGNQMIHAPHTGDVVKISALTGWYASTYVGARRV